MLQILIEWWKQWIIGTKFWGLETLVSEIWHIFWQQNVVQIFTKKFRWHGISRKRQIIAQAYLFYLWGPTMHCKFGFCCMKYWSYIKICFVRQSSGIFLSLRKYLNILTWVLLLGSNQPISWSHRKSCNESNASN